MGQKVRVEKNTIGRRITKAHPERVNDHPGGAEITTTPEASKMMPGVAEIGVGIGGKVGDQDEGGPWINFRKSEYSRGRKVFSEFREFVDTITPANGGCGRIE